MNDHFVAAVLASAVLASLMLLTAAIAACWIRIGKIGRSPLATRREKNLRHLMTLPALAIAAGMLAFALLYDGRTSVALFLGAAFFILCVVPLRSIFIELGLRRMPRNHNKNDA